MLKRVVLVSLFLLVNTNVQAEKIQKCTDENGRVSYQTTPCLSSQGQAEVLSIDSHVAPNYNTIPSNSNSHFNDQSEEYELRRQREALERRRAALKRKEEALRRQCERYTDRWQDAQEDWKNLKRQGYKQSQKVWYEARIKRAKRDMERECN